MILRKPSKIETVVLPKRKKNLMDFMLWMSTSNEAFRMIQKWIVYTPLVLFGFGAVYSFWRGWTEAGVVSALLFAISIYNWWKKKDLLRVESGVSMQSLVDGKFGSTYEESKKDVWEEVLKDGKD